MICFERFDYFFEIWRIEKHEIRKEYIFKLLVNQRVNTY